MHPNAIIHDVEQGSPEWHAARNGILTASEMNLALTPTLKPSNNEKTRQHVYELAAQRITEYTEPRYIGDDMLRGHADEIKARDKYSEHYEPVQEIGFITRDVAPGVVIGYSPDGACVVTNGGIECKSRIQKYQTEVIISNEIPKDHVLQVQTGLLITGWDFIDYISYCGGMPMWVIRCYPIPEYQAAILSAAIDFEQQIKDKVDAYNKNVKAAKVLIETERENMETEVYFE